MPPNAVTSANSESLTRTASRGRRSSSALLAGGGVYGNGAGSWPLPGDPRDLSALLSYGATAALPWSNAWTDNRVNQVNAFKLWTYVAINAIAKRVASQVPNVSWIRFPGDKPKRSDKAIILSGRQKALLPLQAHERLEAVPYQHPLQRLLRSPNDEDTSYDLWYESLLFLFLTGSCYWWVPRNSLGLPAAIHVVPAHWVWPVLGRGEHFIDAWEIRPVEGNYLRRTFPREEIISFRFKNPISKIDGFSPNTAGANWHDVTESLNRARVWSYKQGTFANVAVSFDGKLQDPTDEQLRRIEAKFYQRYTGEPRAGRPLFLPPGVTAKPLNILPNQMVFGETAAETRDNTLACFGVPLAVVGSSSVSSSYGENAAAQTAFCTNTINPLCTFLGLGVTEKFAALFDPDCRVWWERTTAEDPILLEDQIKTDLMAGARTPNEIRTARGYEPFPFPWADQPIFPQSMQSLGTTPFGGAHQKPPPSVAPAQQPRDADDNKKFPNMSNICFG